MEFTARIKSRSATGSKIDIAIVVDGVEYVERVQVDDLIDREAETVESKLRLAKRELIQFMRDKRTRRLTPEQCAEFGNRELAI